MLDVSIPQHRGRKSNNCNNINEWSSAAGNGGCTLIKMGLAKQLGLVDQSGWPTQAGRRTTTVRGVVAGATEKVPLMNLTYELRGEHCQLHSSSSRQCLSESTVLLTVVDSVADSSRQ